MVQYHENERDGDVISYAFIFSVRWTELAYHNFIEIEKKIYTYIITKNNTDHFKWNVKTK